MIEPIRYRRTFEALRAEGVRARRGPLAGTFLAGADPEGPLQVGYAVGKPVGSAVDRNRLRRRLRAVVAEAVRAGDQVLPGGALLIRPDPDAARRNPEELRNDVRSLLEALERRRSEAEAR